MADRGLPVLAIVFCALASACGGDGPTTPSGRNYTGEWIGTTAHGTPIVFTISADEKVTSITLGYSFNGCSGSHTFSNLNLDTAPTVICIPGPCSPGISSFRSFSYLTGSPGGPMTIINGLFPAVNRAEGAVAFRDYPGCGSVSGVSWTATRR